MTQKAVEVQDLNEDIDEDGTTAAERASYALAKMQRAAWELARTQQAVTFSGRLPNTPTWEMNDWLMKHPEWRIVQMTSASYSEVGDYGATWTYQVITCLMEKQS